jgi:sarcosine oxidase subunit gamma
MTSPADLPCRSFIYRKLEALDANFAVLGDYAVARDYGDVAGEGETARRMGLSDLSPLARVGFKGAGTVEWLAGQGIRVPDEPNRAVRQDNGVLVARLAAAELLLLGDLAGDPAPIEKLEPAWRAAGVPPESPRGYPLPRRHTHFWFLITGARAAEMFAKICGVDLRPGKFEAGCIAQTSIARMNAAIVRDDQGGVLAYHLLGDSASGAYLWDCLLDAMAEFDGAPVGLAALQAIAGKDGGDA